MRRQQGDGIFQALFSILRKETYEQPEAPVSLHNFCSLGWQVQGMGFHPSKRSVGSTDVRAFCQRLQSQRFCTLATKTAAPLKQAEASYPEKEVEDEEQVLETDGPACFLLFSVLTHLSGLDSSWKEKKKFEKPVSHRAPPPKRAALFSFCKDLTVPAFS